MTSPIALRSPLLFAGAILLALASGCGGEATNVETGVARGGAPAPVIFVSVDTLRSDRLPMYGYDAVETPAYDALRRDSVLVERAYAHLPLTLPSHTSMFTGRLPVEHGLRDNLGYKVDDSIPTLAEILAAEGWSTGAAISAYVLRSSTGIARGFQSYDDQISAVTGVELGGLQRAGGDTLDRALSWLEARESTPFLFLHLYEPHSPYTPPEPFASRYDDPYDGEVAASDAILARLLERLRALGLYDDALIVLVSDHGEGLMDHGEMEHEVLIYRETLQVPMLFKLPGNERAGETVTVPAQLIDVLPTVLDIVGVAPPAGLEGKSVLQLGEGDRDRLIFSESVYPKIHFGWSDLASMIENRYHFIDGPDPELYDLVEDPGETVNIVQQERAVARRLRGAIEEIDRTLLPPAEVDPDVKASLLTLGYVGGGGSAPESGADPKAKVHVLEELGEASQLYSRGRFTEAAAAYQSVLDDDPGMVYAREQLAKCLRRAGRTEEALAELRRALEDSGGAPHIALSAAELYLSLGNLDEAEVHAEIAKTQNEAAWDLLAQIALQRGDLDTASRFSETALSARGTRVEPLVTLTELRVLQGRFADALQVAAQAEREFGERPDREVLRGLWLQKGIALANLQRNDESEQAFLAEIALSPAELVPYSRLAVLYVVRGEPQKAVDTLRRMVETNDRPAAYVEAAKTFRALGNEAAAQRLLATARQRFPGASELR